MEIPSRTFQMMQYALLHVQVIQGLHRYQMTRVLFGIAKCVVSMPHCLKNGKEYESSYRKKKHLQNRFIRKSVCGV